MEFLKRTWAEIDLDALRYNAEAARSCLSDTTEMLAVVKADAYGHGDRMVSRELADMGVKRFGVSNLEEAVGLRNAGITGEILIFGVTPASMARELAEYRVTQAILNLQYAHELSEAARAAGVTVEGHLKLDTGMGRIGFVVGRPSGSTEALLEACRLPGLKITGAFSHFSSSDDPSEEGVAYTREQYRRFRTATTALKAAGAGPLFLHLQNSAGIISYPQYQFDGARAGVVLYGQPLDLLPGRSIDLKPVMSLRSTVAMVKDVEPGDCISYSRTFRARKPMRIATVPVGYADGYLRAFSNRADVLIRGKRARVVGNVCMDQIMVDVTNIPDAAEGDQVTLAGRDGGEEITFSELASLAGTIHYELLCLVGKRVPRLYFRGGQVVKVLDFNRS